MSNYPFVAHLADRDELLAYQNSERFTQDIYIFCPQMKNKDFGHGLTRNEKGEKAIVIKWLGYKIDNTSDLSRAERDKLDDDWLNTPLPDDLPEYIVYHNAIIPLVHDKTAMAYGH